MRGVFTSGVIDQLLDQDIWFDEVYGVSAGAAAACSFVARQRDRAYATSTDFLKNPDFASMKNLRKTGDYFGADFIYHKIPEELYPIDNETFMKSGVEFHACVTNAITGQAEYPVIRDMTKDMKIVRASCALPIMANMVPMDGYVYMDGGIADSIPVKEAQRHGCDKVVVVLTQPFGYRKKKNLASIALVRAKYRRYPKMVEALERRAQVYNETLDYIQDGVSRGTIFAVAPMGDLGIARTEKDPNKLRKGYEEGFFVMEGLMEKMKAYLAE